MRLLINGIEKGFGEKQVLKSASCSFEKGKIYGLLGRNGAGKTTLFNCLSGEFPYDKGEVSIQESSEMRAITEDDIGYVFSTPTIPEFLTGYEFLKFYIDINKKNADPSKSIDDYFDMVKIKQEDRHRLMRGYSHGMKNKMQMLCFIVARPPIILLDEPLTSFDVVVALEIKQLLKSMKENHIIIFSTHILQLATDLCDEIVILNNGKLEEINHDLLKSQDFEQNIIAMLKDEE